MLVLFSEQGNVPVPLSEMSKLLLVPCKINWVYNSNNVLCNFCKWSESCLQIENVEPAESSSAGDGAAKASSEGTAAMEKPAEGPPPPPVKVLKKTKKFAWALFHKIGCKFKTSNMS